MITWAPIRASLICSCYCSPEGITVHRLHERQTDTSKMHYLLHDINFYVNETAATIIHCHQFPSPALPGSGSKGMISARFVKAPP